MTKRYDFAAGLLVIILATGCGMVEPGVNDLEIRTDRTEYEPIDRAVVTIQNQTGAELQIGMCSARMPFFTIERQTSDTWESETGPSCLAVVHTETLSSGDTRTDTLDVALSGGDRSGLYRFRLALSSSQSAVPGEGEMVSNVFTIRE
jgi:hypothetical protein